MFKKFGDVTKFTILNKFICDKCKKEVSSLFPIKKKDGAVMMVCKECQNNLKNKEE